MRIAICGIHIESSTLSLHRAAGSDFELWRGGDLLGSLDLEAWLDEETRAAIEWVPVLYAGAGTSGGPVVPDAYDAFESEILRGLADAGELDGVYVMLHGAMTVLGREGAEEQLVTRIREVVGDRAVLSASMDPHGNLSRELAATLDFAACHREAPHTDYKETRRRAVRALVDIIRTGVRPAKAWVRVPVLLPGENTATIAEPGRSVFGRITHRIAAHNVIDANLWTGFAWADEPRCAASVLCVADDADSALACAAEIAADYWSAREQFRIVVDHVGTLEDALVLLRSGTPTPLVVSDSGDNVTAGGTGDITFALHHILAHQGVLGDRRTALIAGLVDPKAVAAVAGAGVGDHVTVAVGAGTDARYGNPITRTWTLQQLIHADSDPASVNGALLTHGNVSVLVQRARDPFVAPDDPAFPPGLAPATTFIDFGDYDLVVVKNGYQFPSQVRLAGTSFLALTPGGTDLDPQRIQASRLTRPIYPVDHDFEADLTPELLSTGRPGIASE